MKKEGMPKILAVYLPQFYENEDNNRWWGKGFTDWESVKSAEPYFPQHDEPKVPLNNDYYDLSQKETMASQAELAKKYGAEVVANAKTEKNMASVDFVFIIIILKMVKKNWSFRRRTF